jgi:uncharacterized protein YbbK (DUF523 family)/uncharacterized protein YbgA (DUF1722 family)
LRALRGPCRHDAAALRIGVSSCLLGEKVRYDGGHKRNRFLTDELAPYVEWIPVCPEVELGMGTPRETVQLVRERGGLHLRGTRSRRDWTRGMQAYAARRVGALERLEPCGYVLKQGSPSCGMERVAVRGAKGVAKRDGRGLFAAALLAANPALPVEEEGRLDDPALRENWIERVFAYRRLRSLFRANFSVGRLVAFHAAHELQLRAHGAEAQRRLGRLVAGAEKLPRAELRRRYAAGFMQALTPCATRRRHASVLRHCLGILRVRLDADTHAALAAQVSGYEKGRVPLLAPVTQIRRLVEQLGSEALAGQLYLDPHPHELLLRGMAVR